LANEWNPKPNQHSKPESGKSTKKLACQFEISGVKIQERSHH
jgi:hypothetical protein